MPRKLGISAPMRDSRIDIAMARIDAALARIDAARELTGGSGGDGGNETERVSALVNAHEKLREEVADTIGELDVLISELEG